MLDNFPKIEARPWKPQDLIDDLQLLIDEEHDSYLNTRLSTMLMARDYLKEYFSKLERPHNPFINDPFALVWKAFKNLYPDKECVAYYDQHQGEQNDEGYGFTHFPDDGSNPIISIYAEHGLTVQVETFAHELAHVAVGREHDHDGVWEAAFDAIFREYNRIGDELFGNAEKEGENNGSQ